jgi:hypothetical protein
MPDIRRVVVVGATGEIGRPLVARLLSDGAYTMTILSRNPAAARQRVPGAAEYVAWQPELTGSWAAALDGAYAVVNLAGAPAFTRWTPEYRRFLRENRLTIIRGLVNAMDAASVRPQVFISASSVGAYGFTTQGNQEVDEDTPPDADDQATESQEYEREAMHAESLGVRTVVTRTGFVLDRDGGGLPGMAASTRRGWGGIILPGSQWLPWIHIADVVGIIVMALGDPRVRGAINTTAPDSVTNRTFARTLGQVVHRRVFMRVPGWLLRRFLGGAAIILTRGRRIVPKRAQALGYQFQYPTLDGALTDLVR